MFSKWWTLVTLCFAVATCALAADDDLWLGFSFEDTTAPTAGTAKDSVKVTYLRDSEAVGPDGVVAAAGTPRFTAGVKGKGLFLGGPMANLLSPALSDMAFPDGKIDGIVTQGAAVLAPVTGTDAWTGTTCAKATTNAPGDMVAIPLNIPGGLYSEGNPYLYLFSLYVKGNGTLEMRLATPDTAKVKLGPAVAITATGAWKRYTVWLFAEEATEAALTLTNTGAQGTFFFDGLQLEQKLKGQVLASPKSAPYGTNFSAGPWMKGGAEAKADTYRVAWKGVSFPYTEGSISAWVKPAFNMQDAESHYIISRSHVYYSLIFMNFNQYAFYRANDGEDKAKNLQGEVRQMRPKAMQNGEWCLLTATWSNTTKMTRLYFNGELIGERPSLNETDRPQLSNLTIGNWVPTAIDSLNGTLDELNIYSRALSPEEIAQAYAGGPQSAR